MLPACSMRRMGARLTGVPIVVSFIKAASSKFKRAATRGSGILDNPSQMRRYKTILCDWLIEILRFSSQRARKGFVVASTGETRPAADADRTTGQGCAPAKKILSIFCLVLALAGSVRAQDAPSEYRIKAAFLYNFAKFVEWPPQTFAGPTAPIIIGVLGENVFGGNLEQTLRGKTINSHPLQFRTFSSATEATNCQILFISPSEKGSLPKIFEDLHGACVLTVSETDHFTANGGMINFVLQENKIRFQINDAAAKKAGLQISSKLLSLALPER